MKKILFALLLLSSVAQAQIKTYAPNRNTGNVIVTDVAFRASEFMQLPYANSSSPSIGSYPDSSGRIFYNRLDSTIIIRNVGTWLKYYNSVKINAMDALNAHLAGVETFTGAKTFNGNITSAGTTTVANDIVWNNNTGYGLKGNDGQRFLSYTTAGGVLINSGVAALTVSPNTTFSANTTTSGTATIANDIIWNNNTGYGLKGQDGVRFHYYTTAGGVVIGTTATPISLKSLTTAGVVLTTSAGLVSSITKLTTANIDTGRTAIASITGGTLNKVRDSIVSIIPSSASFKLANDSSYNTGYTTRVQTKRVIDSLAALIPTLASGALTYNTTDPNGSGGQSYTPANYPAALLMGGLYGGYLAITTGSYTVNGNYRFIELKTGASAVGISSTASGQEYYLVNTTGSAISISFTLKDLTGATLTTVPANTSYHIFYNGTEYLKL